MAPAGISLYFTLRVVGGCCVRVFYQANALASVPIVRQMYGFFMILQDMDEYFAIFSGLAVPFFGQFMEQVG